MGVIMSIKPEWCKKIISGEKKTEVRKSEPDHVRFPFRVFVYASFGGENWFRYGKQMSGHVIGEFTCNTILLYNMNAAGVELLSRSSCVPPKDLRKYANGASSLCGWKISEFKLYDMPLPIGLFMDTKGNRLKRPPQSWRYAYERMGLS